MGAWGGPGGQANPNQTPASQGQEQKYVDQLVEEGFAALKNGDSDEAMGKFDDALQLRPFHGKATLGMALAKAANKNLVACQSGLDTAADKYKGNPHTISYDSAIVAWRLANRGRALLLLNKYLVENKPKVDEMMLNAQLSLMIALTDAERKAVSALPAFQKTAEQALATLAAAHAGEDRWGLEWLPKADVEKLKASGEKPRFPSDLPLLLPDDSPLPDKGQHAQANPLLPHEAKMPPADALAGGSGAGEKPAEPQSQNAPPAKVAVPAGPAKSQEPTTLTVRGAAFAVASDLLVTSSRLVAGAVSIEIQSIDTGSAPATVVAIDADLGLALLKAERGNYGPIALADSFRTGPAAVAAFVKPGVFQPQLELLRGELSGSADKPSLRMSQHPRTMGSPVVDAMGKLLAMVAAQRDEAPAALSVVGVAAVRQFLTGKTKFAAQSGDPGTAVVEVHVTRKMGHE